MRAKRARARRSLAGRLGKWLAGCVLALLLILALALAAVFSLEQSTLRPLAEYLVKSATGREFSIDGELDARAGRVVRLTAGGIRLANADWGSAQPMLSIARAEISIDLLRLVKGAPAADSLLVDGAQLLFEQDSAGRSNWAMGPAAGSPRDDARAPPPAVDATPMTRVLPVIRSRLSDIDVTVIDARLSAPLEIHFAAIEHRVDRDDELQASIDGEVTGRPFELQARINPISQLLVAGAVNIDLTAASRSVTLGVQGKVDSLARPRQASAHVSVTAEDIGQVLARLGLPPLASGAAELKASLLPADGHHALDLYAALDSLQLDAQARLQALDSIDGASVSLSARGEDLAAAGRLAGVAGLPSQPFNLASNVALAGSVLTIGETRFDSGSIHLDAQGAMNRFPSPEGSNLRLKLAGENYLELAELLGVGDVAQLKPEPFDLRAELSYSDHQRQLFNARVTLADISGEFSGTLIDYPRLVGSELDYRLSGRNDALVRQWLPRPTRIDGEYALQGKIRRSASGYDIERAELSLGANALQVSGKLGNQPLLADTELSMRFRGPDLEKIAVLAGYDGFFPAGDSEINADARARNNEIDIGKLDARLGNNRLQASGLVNSQDVMSGSRVQLALEGKDIAEVLPPGLHVFVDSGQSFALKGRLATVDQRLAIDAMQARLGAVELQVSGNLSTRQPMQDAALNIDLRGPDLAALIPDGMIPYELPAEQFEVSGGIALRPGGLTLDGVEARVGANRLAASGTVPLDSPTQGLALSLSASGPNLAAVVPVDADQLGLTELSYELSVELTLGDGLLSLQALDFSTPRGNLTGNLSVALDDPRASGRFDLRATGDNLEEFAPSTPDYQPAAVAFDLDARGNWDARTLSVEQGALKLGSALIEASGKISLPPDAIASQLSLSARGDNLADLGQVYNLVFPSEAFSVDATLQSDANSLKIPELVARLGASDLQGSLEVDFAEKPTLRVKLDSNLLDIAAHLPEEDESAEVEPAPGDGRVIPQFELRGDRLNALDFEVRINLGELRFKRNDLRDIEIDASLQHGHLKVRQLQATAAEGQLSAQFEAIAQDDRLVTRGELSGKDIVLGKAKSKDPAISLPKQDLRLGFDTEGATVRELAANLDGFAQLVGGDGRLQNSRALGLFGSFFEELLNAINPFVTQEPYTTISCYAVYAEIVDGVAVIKPGAVMQTDKLNMFARGQVDLNSEKIALRFDTSARSGIGISVADFINPFVGVSGTLAKPGLGVDPKNAMFEGSFAYATGGLSIVARSLFNRWFRTKDPCARLRQEAAELEQEKQEAAAEEAARQEETNVTE